MVRTPDASRGLYNRLKRIAEPAVADICWRLRTIENHTATLILAYHNVRPSHEGPAGERSLHIPWALFCQHLDLIVEVAEVVPLAQAVQQGQIGSRPRVALTFDDAYEAAVELALPELARRGLPATMFVAPQMLDGSSFWWDQLADPLAGVLPANLRRVAMEGLEGRQTLVGAWAAANGLPWNESLPAWATGASLSALVRAVALPGMTFESHSWSHPNLTAISREALAQELEAPRLWLRRHGIGNGDWLAYPYGLVTPETARAARAAGYQGALRVSGGFLSGSSNLYSLPRFNVPAQLSRAGLKIRLGGWRAT